ncbi:unnamed protein product, partial [Symbiodinium pilosum]
MVATDATPSSGGAVAAEVPTPLAAELWRQAEITGEAVRIDRGVDADWDALEPKQPSVFASSVAECLPWRVTSSYSFKQTSHVNLQELRALRREVIRLAAHGKLRGTILIALNDSRVVVGAVAKGRSSSFKLNGLLRGMLPHLVLGQISLAVLWIETAANPADHPSRFRSLPPPRRPRDWLRRFGVCVSKDFKGLEVFAGVAGISRAHVVAGLDMGPPVDVLYGSDARAAWIDDWIRRGLVQWLWFVDPCEEGDASNPEVALGNELWERALSLAWQVMDAGGFFILEHPRGSKAWQLESTHRLLSHDAVHLLRIDSCAFEDALGLRSANLTPSYRQRLRVASVWLFDLACSLGARLTRKTPAPVIDRVLERCIDVAYQN